MDAKRITPEMVLTAYAKTKWFPKTACMKESVDGGGFCGCAIGVLYAQALKSGDILAIENHDFIWASKKFGGQQYISSFISAFDGLSKVEGRIQSEIGYQDGVAVRNAVFGAKV